MGLGEEETEKTQQQRSPDRTAITINLKLALCELSFVLLVAGSSVVSLIT
jgi:hypothetical protein